MSTWSAGMTEIISSPRSGRRVLTPPEHSSSSPWLHGRVWAPRPETLTESVQRSRARQTPWRPGGPSPLLPLQSKLESLCSETVASFNIWLMDDIQCILVGLTSQWKEWQPDVASGNLGMSPSSAPGTPVGLTPTSGNQVPVFFG